MKEVGMEQCTVYDRFMTFIIVDLRLSYKRGMTLMTDLSIYRGAWRFHEGQISILFGLQ